MIDPVDRPRRLVVLVAACGVVAGIVGIGFAIGIGAATTTVTATDVPQATDAVLVVADADSGERLLEVPADDGTEVTLAYTHSVEKTDVRDVYAVDDGSLRMVRMEFDSYGAGLPADADVDRTDDGLVATVDRTYDRLRVVPGPIAGHELVVDDTRYDLLELVGLDAESTDESAPDREGNSSTALETTGDADHGPGLELFVETRAAVDEDEAGETALRDRSSDGGTDFCSSDGIDFHSSGSVPISHSSGLVPTTHSSCDAFDPRSSVESTESASRTTATTGSRLEVSST